MDMKLFRLPFMYSSMTKTRGGSPDLDSFQFRKKSLHVTHVKVIHVT